MAKKTLCFLDKWFARREKLENISKRYSLPQLDGHRWDVIRYYYHKKNLAATAKHFNISRSAIYKWLRQLQNEYNLTEKQRGRPKAAHGKLTKEQVIQLRNIIENKMPIDLSLNYPAWSNKVVRKLILQEYRVDVSLQSVSRLLVSLGFLPPVLDYGWLNLDCRKRDRALTLKQYAKSNKAIACLLLIMKSSQMDMRVIYVMTARGHIDFCCVPWDADIPFEGLPGLGGKDKFRYRPRHDFIIDFLKTLKRNKHKKLVVGYVELNLRKYICGTVNSLRYTFRKDISFVRIPYKEYVKLTLFQN